MGILPMLLFNKLRSSEVGGDIDEDLEPRSLLARADLRSINRQRRQLLNNFGFEDTISDPGNERSGSAVNARRLKEAGRRTLLGRRNVNRSRG